jgi:hypothetical protein
MIHPDRLAALKAERQAADVAVLMQQIEAARRLESMRALGRTLAAERFTYAEMTEIWHRTHDPWCASLYAPGVEFNSAQEWAEFCRGVHDVLALV